jgi:alpha-glucosidase
MITNTNLEYKGNLFPKAYKTHTKKANLIEFESQNGVLLQIHVLRDSLLRFRYAPEGYFGKGFFVCDRSKTRTRLQFQLDFREEGKRIYYSNRTSPL